MATVESSDIDVVVEFGVPLLELQWLSVQDEAALCYAYGTSIGVTGSEGGGGMFNRVGALEDIAEAARSLPSCTLCLGSCFELYLPPSFSLALDTSCYTPRC